MDSEASGSATVEIEASADEAWSLIVDIERMGEREWSSECEVLACSPGEEFAFHVLRVQGAGGLREVPPEGRTPWQFRIERSDEGAVQLTETFNSPWIADPGSPPAQIPGRRQMMVEGCQTTVARLKHAAERGS